MTNKKLHEGMIKRHPDGFGFFIPDDPDAPDVYIPRHSMSGVMTNDRVAVQIEKERGTDRFRGDIAKILERGTKKIVGRFEPTSYGGLIKDEGKGWGQDLKIKTEHVLAATKDQLVAAEILSYPDNGKEFWGKIIQIIGSQEDPLTDLQRVIHSQHIPFEFSERAEAEAAKLKPEVSPQDIRNRQDLRHLNFITIDGATAKDFDDAIYIEQNHDGFRLYVAIADVSHYVRPGTGIDADAVERGTSVYFPNFVVPMLPEVLSNHLCSLNPMVDRLALVADMQMSFTGELSASRFYEAVIKSKARVTYGEAQEIIDGNSIEKFSHVSADILRASDLAKILMAKRFREGSLDLEIPETQMMIDAGGNPIDIIRSERLFAHRLIEEMMLAANVAVARFLADREIPALYRIHEPPNPDAIAVLERYLRTFGGRVQLDNGKLQKRLTKALQEFEGKAAAQVLNILALRSMSQAKYSANNVGHFGLGFEFYTHFTSPIRRYPDLIIHRLIKSQIMPESAYRIMTEEDLVTAGAMLSACEQRSVKAERQIQAIKKARFMHKHIGEEFEGVISSVTKFGLFVLLRQFEVDGLVHIDNLGSSKYERFEYDEERLVLVSKRSGHTYSIGDTIHVRVVSADSVEGKIDFELATKTQSNEVRPKLKDLGRKKPGQKNRDKQYGKPAESKPLSRRARHQGSPAEKYASTNSKNYEKPKRGRSQTDEIDLDQMKVHDHAKEISKNDRGSFDPGAKLAEALRKRGLRPTVGDTEPVGKIGFGNRGKNGSRYIPDEEIDLPRKKSSQGSSDESQRSDRGQQLRKQKGKKTSKRRR